MNAIMIAAALLGGSPDCAHGVCAVPPATCEVHAGQPVRNVARVAVRPVRGTVRFFAERKPVRTFFARRQPVRRVLRLPFRLLRCR
jgi:hypothetical protein